LRAEPPMASIADLRKRLGPQLTDEELLLRATMPGGQVDAMLAAGPAPREYDPSMKPTLSLIRKLTAQRDIAQILVEKPGFRLELRRHAAGEQV
jgi:oxaloacetate decarboxylase alpha subunit